MKSYTEESKQKIGEASRKRWADSKYKQSISRKVSNSLKDHKVSNITKQKISNSLKELWKNPSYEQIMRNSLYSEEAKRKQRLNSFGKGSHHTKEAKDKMSSIAKNRWQDKNYRQKMINIFKMSASLPERKESTSKRMKNLWKNLYFREQLTEFAKRPRPWAKGRKYSMSSKAKMSIAHLGKPLSVEHCANISKALKLNKSKRQKALKRYWASLSAEEKNLHIEKMAKKSREATGLRPNKFESKILHLIKVACPNEYKYTGDASLIINGLNPDFANVNGKKKLIEAFGDYFHNANDNWRRSELGRIMAYNSLGFDCLVIWEHDLRNKTDDELIKQIQLFNKK